MSVVMEMLVVLVLMPTPDNVSMQRLYFAMAR